MSDCQPPVQVESSFSTYLAPPQEVGEDITAVIAQPLDDGRVDVVWSDSEDGTNPFFSVPPPDYEELFGPQDERLIQGHGLLESARLTLGITVPPLNIVMHIVGSSEDVQPFIPVALRLVQAGHRVRVATHELFRSLVREQGLEFYPLGGDPEECVAFAVKDRTFIPGISSLVAENADNITKPMAEILKSTFESCVEPDDETGEPFYANVIIANPPSFGFIHCAEALGIPCHVIFTMPWTATKAFPHPLTNVSYNSEKPSTTINYASYGAVEMLTWIGLADQVNDFRRSIGLRETSSGTISTLLEKVPHTYLWSPALIPKPKDWGDLIDVVGFSFVDATADYTPPQDLVDWLAAGTKPFYIGFGSIAGFDMTPLIEKIMLAVREVGIRVIVSKGWEGASVQNSQDVYLIGDCPHDWLFTQVAGVVHHGGAATAVGLRLGRPTIICPFVGDQPFWGAMCARAGVGPVPIQARDLTVELMAAALQFCRLDTTIEAAAALAQRMREETGADAAVRSFILHLPVEDLKNSIHPSSLAVIVHKPTGSRLSWDAARVLLTAGRVKRPDLVDYKPRVWNTMHDMGDVFVGTAPIKGVYKAFEGAIVNPVDGYKNNQLGKGIAKGVGGLVWYPTKGIFLTLGQLGNGFRALPVWYDPENNSKPRTEITGIKTGLIAAGKATGHNLLHSLTDILVLPVTMGLKEGPKGIARGFAVGTANLAFKGSSAVVDIVTMPAKGVYRQFVPKDLGNVSKPYPGQLSRLPPLPTASAHSSKHPEINIQETAQLLDMGYAPVRDILEIWDAEMALKVAGPSRMRWASGFKSKKTRDASTDSMDELPTESSLPQEPLRRDLTRVQRGSRPSNDFVL